MTETNQRQKYYTSPETISNVLILRNIERKSLEEIASECSISRNTVSKILKDYKLSESFTETVQKYLADNMGEAVKAVMEVMRDSENRRTQLEAAKMLLSIGGVQQEGKNKLLQAQIDKLEAEAKILKAQADKLEGSVVNRDLLLALSNPQIATRDYDPKDFGVDDEI